MKQPVLLPRKFLGFLIVSGALLLMSGMGFEPAQAAAKQHARTAHKAAHAKPGHRKTAGKKSGGGKVAAAKAKPQPSLAITIKAPNDAPDFDYQPRIAEAQDLAARQPVLPGDMQVDGGKLTQFTWVLVVGARTGPLTVVRMDEAGRNDKGLTITWPVNNYLNTKFSVTAPAGLMVFAQRRPVRGKTGFEEAVYTAYAPELDTKKMRDAGIEYLRHLERLAFNHVNDHDVRSRVAPKLTVAEEIPRDMVMRLMITEHVDPLHMKFVGIEQCVHEVLITIAANKSRAYAYARSSAGALGLPQFMENSYQMVRDNYPAARLEPDFNLGMTDLSNAMLASMLLLDLELTELPQAMLKKFTDSAYHLSAFLAAGYNRNPVKVVRTYQRTGTFTGGDVSFENKMYVRTQDWVGAFLKREYGRP
jgi:hypothetical protein